MTRILDSLPADYAKWILCCYINTDRKIKIARITNTPHRYFERVVFPGERLLFKALPAAFPNTAIAVELLFLLMA